MHLSIENIWIIEIAYLYVSINVFVCYSTLNQLQEIKNRFSHPALIFTKMLVSKKPVQ